MSEPWKVNSWCIFIVIFTAIFFFTTSSLSQAGHLRTHFSNSISFLTLDLL